MTALLSYSASAEASVGNPRMIGLEALVDICERLYGPRNVRIERMSYDYRQFNSASLSNARRADHELLVVASVAP